MVFDSVGYDCSLRNNLMASANGWGIPIKLTLLGPLRSCIYPSNLRSINV
jgi:hypothetical protein